VVRRLNSDATLRALRQLGEPTLTELASQAGLSRPTAEAVLAELAGRGLAQQVAPRAGRHIGRPARRYRFRAEAGLALGMEIDAHRAVVLLSDLDGRLVGAHHAELKPTWPRRERMAAVRAAARACLRDAHTTRADVWAVAAGTPGVVDRAGRVASCTVVPDWTGIHLGRELGRSFTCPVLVENDANLAAVAEQWRGIAADVDDLVYVFVGRHTGAGTIIGGQLHRGRWGAAGEVGILPELGWQGTTAALAGRQGPDIDGAAAKILAAAAAGDAHARERVAALAARVARGVAALVLAMDPEMVVVGGPLTSDTLVAELRQHVRPLCLTPVRMEASTLHETPVAFGAVRLALDRIEADLRRAV
jgi:predicted NBD/HSP70 family sugar kinase